MRMRFWAGAVGLIVVFLSVCLFLWISRIDSSQFKSFAEQKVSSFLKTKVSIGDIRVGLLNHVSLSGLEIGDSASSHPYEVRIDHVIFQYNLLRFFTQNLYAPTAILLEAPEISFPGELFPYEIFRQLNFGQGKTFVSSLKMRDGYIRYPIPALQTYVELRNVHGAFKPVEFGIFNVDFTGSLTGFLEGEVRIQGQVHALEKTHDLTLNFKNLRFGSRVRVPFEEINGKVRWHNDNIEFENLTADVHGWNLKMRGKIENFSEKVLFQLKIMAGKGKSGFEANLTANLPEENISGRLIWPGIDPIVLSGKIKQRGLRYELESLQVGSFYESEGWIDFNSGDYRFHLFNETQKHWVHSNLIGLDLKLRSELNHVRWYGLDVAAVTHVHLIPYEDSEEERMWRFQGTFYTDYFILEYLPLDDFRGSFEITPFGIKNFISSWGNVFDLRGDISFRQKPYVNFTLKVDGFNLSEVKNFANKPLPKNLGGLVEGKLKFEGNIDQPEILGHFTVKEGLLGKLNYDLGVIQFRGHLPYLNMYDSRVMRGRTALSLEGALDFSLDNIFHGVEIRTPDKFAIWKGWELSTSESEGSLEIGRVDLLPISLKAGHPETLNSLQEPAKQEEEKYLVVGPKVRF